MGGSEHQYGFERFSQGIVVETYQRGVNQMQHLVPCPTPSLGQTKDHMPLTLSQEGTHPPDPVGGGA